jgi:hypothetical protein
MILPVTKMTTAQPVSYKYFFGIHHYTNCFTFATTDSLSSDFDIATWPVADRCKGHLQDLRSTHNVCPLPAYDTDHSLIPPLEYESKLKGALVEVHMAFFHHRVKNAKRDVFNAILRQLTVLSPPAAMPINPFKRHRLNTGPLNARNKKAK